MNHTNSLLTPKSLGLYSFATLFILSSILIPFGGLRVYAEGTPSVSVTPSAANLGTSVSVVVNVTSPGVYTVVVTKPDGSSNSQLDYTFSSAGGQAQKYGNLTIGFKTLIDQVGKYTVVLQQNGTQLAVTSFSATDKLIVEIKMVNNGITTNPCFPDYTFSRGDAITVLIMIRYASTGQYVNGALDKNMTARFTLPNGTWAKASFAAKHNAWTMCFDFPWNYYAGPWNVNATASDSFGNKGVYGNFLQVTYQVTPAPLTISGKVANHATGQNATSSLSSGETLDLSALVSYLPPTGPTQREIPAGYNVSLSPTRGGVVTALIGWGFYNQTSNKFGGNDTKHAGGLVATVPLAYNASSGLYTATYKISDSLPNRNYTVVMLASDGASPANSGLSIIDLPASSTAVASSGISVELAAGVAVAVLAVGLLVGSLLIRRKGIPSTTLSSTTAGAK